MAQIFRGHKSTISVSTSGGSSVPVGALQDVEIEVSRNIEVLFGSGSIKRQDQQQTELEIGVSATVSSWDAAAWKDLVDWNSTDTVITDSTDVPLFDIEAVRTDSSGATLTVTVEDIYFEDLPISGDKDSYVELDLNGTGKDIITATEA